ncbi:MULTISPECIES: C4-type zinc ribbon domain-containing protein [unclassified Arcicella]|uniref:zinc ribbon domain-containing protein n=1 Tax=unclassified Arcicella TaxID=2644986 RepID=UPI0028602243|nr:MULTISPECIES: C4-type zinc ribbon domain-containing protein [unclassified Arcicella]MDR6560393.1 putative nucleic acid-binding Zn-ribbon protein [Arcicella sp. BE51]MDR6810001.1 putative nucleic acid-binding Zn-ribbon protein [Arcicella sp. BE140]MDR6821350.1 putative nucleic acid-binding Zn-ribbon protein [Arcicella sp. BE139]
MAAVATETTIAQKLEALLKLQNIDSALDGIKKMRGDLPEEVRDLEDEVAGIETRISKFNKEIAILEEDITKNRNAKKEAEKLVNKYKDQQMNVRNNREYDAISKEIELQQLEMELADKRTREFEFKILNKKDDVSETETRLNTRKKDLDAKRKELSVLIAESEEDEQKLMSNREKAVKFVEERLLRPYDKLRGNYPNGLAVVLVKRGACGGCFSAVPPQRQADIKDKKRIIVCEHCGRILADVEDIVFISKK